MKYIRITEDDMAKDMVKELIKNTGNNPLAIRSELIKSIRMDREKLLEFNCYASQTDQRISGLSVCISSAALIVSGLTMVVNTLPEYIVSSYGEWINIILVCSIFVLLVIASGAFVISSNSISEKNRRNQLVRTILADIKENWLVYFPEDQPVPEPKPEPKPEPILAQDTKPEPPQDLEKITETTSTIRRNKGEVIKTTVTREYNRQGYNM